MAAAPVGEPTRDLLDRLEALLPDEVREVRMFGVVALMLEDSMAVAAGKDGSLLVRVDPADDAALLERPGTSRPEMGNGRSMGVGWIRVDAAAVADDASLRAWVEEATGFLARRRA